MSMSQSRPGSQSTEQEPAALPVAPLFFLPQVLFALLVAATLVVNIGPANLAPIDGIAVAIVVMYVPSLLRLRNPYFSEVWHRLWPYLGAYLGLGLVLLVVVSGDPLPWLKDLVSFGYLFLGLALLLLTKYKPTLALPKFVLLASTYFLLAFTIWTHEVGRGSGTFVNPNLTGSWFAAALVTMLALEYPKRLVWRVPALMAAGYGLLISGSLGFMVALVVAGAFVLGARLGLATWVQVAVTGLACGVAYVLLPFLEALTPYSQQSGVTRLGRSSEGRLEIWTSALNVWRDQPFGLGPGGFSDSRTIVLKVNGAETHNDYIGVLVDYGVLGLIAWLAILVALFRVSRAGRPMVVFIAAAGLTHSVINYRHLWLLLALLVAAGFWSARDAATRSSTEAEEKLVGSPP